MRAHAGRFAHADARAQSPGVLTSISRLPPEQEVHLMSYHHYHRPRAPADGL